AAPPNSTGHKPTCTEKDSRTPAGLSRTSLFGSCPEPMPTLTTATTGPNPTTAAMLRPRSSGQTSWPQKLTTTQTTCWIELTLWLQAPNVGTARKRGTNDRRQWAADNGHHQGRGGP